MRSAQRGLAAAFLAAVCSVVIPMPAYAGQVTFRWDYSASGAAGFKLYCGAPRGKYTIVVDVGNTDVYKFAGMPNARLYQCAVTVYDSRRLESAPSTPVRLYVSDSGRCVTGCDADLDHDGAVSGNDTNLLRQMWGTGDVDADLNGDGFVNILDLALFRALSQ